MPRPRKEEYADDGPCRPGPRKEYGEEYDDVEDAPDFEEPKQHPRPRKATPKRKPQYVDDDEDEELEEDDDDHDDRNKQLVVRKPKKTSKSKGKELMRRKKEDITEEEDSSSSSEEDKKAEKKAKKKAKARNKEVITKKAWEPVPRGELDLDFVALVAEELGHARAKIHEGLEEELIQRHTETGEYNIDAFFDNGIFSAKDKKKWKQCVSQLKANKNKSEVLFCSFKDQSPNLGYAPSHVPSYDPGYAPGYAPGYGTTRVYGAPQTLVTDNDQSRRSIALAFSSDGPSEDLNEGERVMLSRLGPLVEFISQCTSQGNAYRLSI
ncbi:MAG: hypothetical protein Q9184_000348 [Pyrenodesmia sp. 2 TL-2023]